MKKLNWGYMELSDSGTSLKVVISPREAGFTRVILKDIQQKLVVLFEKLGLEVRRIKK